MIYDVTDLNVYNRSLSALNLLYILEKQIPQTHLKLTIQFTSAGESVPANIAEGFAKRRAMKEWKRFLAISMGSSDEVITQIRSVSILANHAPRIDKDLCNQIIDEYKIISKQLNKLRNNWIDYNTK